MSLIGPRPIVKKEVELYYGEEVARQIFRVKPGVTGFWQVSGRNDVKDYQTRIDLDLYYIHNWSLWLDLVIIMRTVQILINADGAY
jgi:undecaprenyl-phosphate galactose phosphotransferase